MVNFRYTVRLFTAFLKRFRGILLLSVFCGFLIFVASRFLAPLVFGNDTEKIGYVGRYNTTNLPSPILNLIGEGLTRLDESGQPTKALADTWESSDGKVWKFTLAEGKYWQDGTLVTSSTIAYSFQDVKVEYPDSKTIIFTLEAPFAPFPTVVSKTVFKRGLLGTGEWEVKSVSLANGVVEELKLENKDKKTKIYHFYPSEDQAKLAFKMGEIDIIEDAIDPTPLDNWSTVEIDKKNNLKRFVAIFFNTQHEQLAEKSTRQALSYAINKERFGMTRAANPLSPLSWAYNAQTKPYAYDQSRAKDLLAGRGISELKLTTVPVLLSTAEAVARDWAEIGIKTTVSVSTVVPEEYQAYMVMYDIPSDPDQYATWHSTQLESNISNYKSIRVDKLLEDGRQELDLEDRKKIYLDFQRFLLEDAPAAFLYHPVSYTIRRK